MYKIHLYRNHLPFLLIYSLVAFRLKMPGFAFVPVFSSPGTDHPRGWNNMFLIPRDCSRFFLFSKTLSIFMVAKCPRLGPCQKLNRIPLFLNFPSHAAQFGPMTRRWNMPMHQGIVFSWEGGRCSSFGPRPLHSPFLPALKWTGVLWRCKSHLVPTRRQPQGQKPICEGYWAEIKPESGPLGAAE